MSDEKAPQSVIIELPAKSLDGIPKMYMNGFHVSVGNSDVVMVMLLNGQAIGTLNMSYTVSKTLVEKLGSVMGAFETASKRSIMTTEDAEKILAEAKNDKPS